MTAPLPVVLASRSPARLKTLLAAGIEPSVHVSGIDEGAFTAPDPAALALVLARAKAADVARQVSGPALVIGCDSVLDLDGEPLGKPADADDARARWRRMRGREAVLVTGHSLVLRNPEAEDREVSAVAETRVRFANVDDDEIAAYVATGEPLHVAGAFTIDGIGGAFVTGVDGDPHNVVGLSLPLVRKLTSGLGLAWHSLWTVTVDPG